MTTLPLHQVPVGATVTVIDVPDHSEIQAQLAARGVLPGALVTVRSSGAMVVVAVDHSRWAISTQHAAEIVTIPLVPLEGGREPGSTPDRTLPAQPVARRA